MGLVNRVAAAGDALGVAEEIAAEILAGGPIAARYAKEVINTGTEMTLDQGILLENRPDHDLADNEGPRRGNSVFSRAAGTGVWWGVRGTRSGEFGVEL